MNNATKPWKTHEIELLRRLYSTTLNAEIAKQMGRGVAAIRHKAGQLRLHKSCRVGEQGTVWRKIVSAKAHEKFEPPRIAPSKMLDPTIKPIIREGVKTTYGPNYVGDVRYLVTEAPRVIDSSGCREWAREVCK